MFVVSIAYEVFPNILNDDYQKTLFGLFIFAFLY